jgi:hypothetical protein
LNSISGFRKCTLTNKELISKVDIHVDNIYQLGEIPSRCIPARVDEDFDLLAGELLLRFQEADKEISEGKEKIKLAEDLLHKLNNLGGLGHDKHRWIVEVLSKIKE